jgi:hypothetical protein
MTTKELLELHERVFGGLDTQSKRRMVAEARVRGWDRARAEIEPIAA